MDVTSVESTSLLRVVVGIDVGGPKKGFHAVALRDRCYLSKFQTLDPLAMVRWCLEINAHAIGIDAPCRWSTAGRARPAERELAANRIHSFATPSRQAAKHQSFYGWMLNGAALYNLLEKHYPLFRAGAKVQGAVCFETFPHAVACALAGQIVSAKRKRTVRRELLQDAGIDTSSLTNIDMIDAALCALAANHLLAGSVKLYGEAVEGFIVVPA